MSTPEQRSRIAIDDLFTATGWAVREFPLKTGVADYLLFIVAKVE